jgi:hypothetical protein
MRKYPATQDFGDWLADHSIFDGELPLSMTALSRNWSLDGSDIPLHFQQRQIICRREITTRC